MKTLPRTFLKVFALPLALTAWACQDSGAPTALLDVPVASSVIVDYEAGDGDQLLFLPPLSSGEPSATLATGLDLTVTICDPLDDCEILSANERDDHYQANWKSDKAQEGIEYSVEVTGAGISLGHVFITLEKKGKDKAGSMFPIKFWVGETLGEAVAEVADCVGDNRCNAEPVPDGEETSIVTLDEEGNTMGEVIFPDNAVPAGGLIVTLDCRQNGFDPGDGPLPTDLDQWPLFCHVDVKNPDGSEFTGSLPDEASIEICVVDELETGQAPYHGFVDQDDLVLGKSSNGVDFTFLAPGPSNLTCEGTTTIIASASPFGRILDALGSRVASVLSPVLPQKLYAAPMRRRDGGVGGLVSSFSDINPVEPAIIEGRVTYGGGGGIGGLTVTLSGDGAATTTTDSNGDYSFGPLQAAVGGSSYTVTVPGLPANETSTAVVSVTGSGSTAADFPTSLYYNSVNDHSYQAIATRLPWATARSTAASLVFQSCGGHLATITTGGEQAFIVATMPQVIANPGSSPFGGYWFGGYQPAGADPVVPGPANPWEWVTGEPFGLYTNWATGEPNNLGNAEHTMHFLGGWTLTEPEKWNDEPGNRPYGYVVEYDCSS